MCFYGCLAHTQNRADLGVGFSLDEPMANLALSWCESGPAKAGDAHLVGHMTKAFALHHSKPRIGKVALRETPHAAIPLAEGLIARALDAEKQDPSRLGRQMHRKVIVDVHDPKRLGKNVKAAELAAREEVPAMKWDSIVNVGIPIEQGIRPHEPGKRRQPGNRAGVFLAEGDRNLAVFGVHLSVGNQARRYDPSQQFECPWKECRRIEPGAVEGDQRGLQHLPIPMRQALHARERNHGCPPLATASCSIVERVLKDPRDS